jgi:uncharacterized protein YbdZ (MbtH family)
MLTSHRAEEGSRAECLGYVERTWKCGRAA